MLTPEHLGRTIRRLRHSKGMSIEALALAAGMDPRHLGRIERGEGNPRLDSLSAIARALDLTATRLLYAAEQEMRC